MTNQRKPVTVNELIDFLTNFPGDTPVDILYGRTSRNYEGDTFGRASLVLPKVDPEFNAETDYMWSDDIEFYHGRDGAPGSLFIGREE